MNDNIEKVVLDLEASVHRRGWDQSAFVAVLLHRGDLPGLRLFPLTEMHLPGSPPQALAHLAQMHLSSEKLNTILWNEFPRFAGVAFVSEGWAGPNDISADEYERIKKAGIRWADHPEAREVRTIILATVEAKLYETFRVRGEKPTFHHHDDITATGGNIPVSLCRIVMAMLRSKPEWEEEMLALEKMIDDMLPRTSIAGTVAALRDQEAARSAPEPGLDPAQQGPQGEDGQNAQDASGDDKPADPEDDVHQQVR